MITGTAFRFGDCVDTDIIIPGKYTKTMDFKDMCTHTFEDVMPGFSEQVQENDFIVAGNDFGIGSSREQAPLALKLCGIRCIVAQSFSRLFYRNAINIGLVLVECDTAGIAHKDKLQFDMDSMLLTDLTTNRQYRGKPMPRIMQSICAAGGVASYIRLHNGELAL